MKRIKIFVRFTVQLLLLGLLIVALMVVINIFLPHQQLALKHSEQTSNFPYPYPPPVEKSSTPSPDTTKIPTVPGLLSTITPFPITPFPTLTLVPGSSPTLIPIIEPAKDAAGTIIFVAKAGKDTKSTLHSISMDATGKALNQPLKMSEDEAQSVGFIYPSPDFNNIAITGGWGELGIYDLNKGKFEPISPTLGPVWEFFNWFPDNRQILYGDENGPLVLADPISGKHTILAAPGYEQVTGAAASPDGQYVVYSSYRNDNSPSLGGLWIVNANGQNAHVFSKMPATQITNIAWSPDGKKIAFFGDGWQVINADGSNLHLLTGNSNVPHIVLPHCYFLPPLWSPDSRMLAVVTSAPEIADQFCHGWTGDIYKGTSIILIDVENGKARPLLSDDSKGNLDPTWSPDGSQIAFVSNRGGSPEIWAMNLDGSNLRPLTENDDLVRFPVWRKLIP
jgi:Tol biopolymer transport system component